MSYRPFWAPLRDDQDKKHLLRMTVQIMFCVIITPVVSWNVYFFMSGVRSTGAVTAVPPPENSCSIYSVTYSNNVVSGMYSRCISSVSFVGVIAVRTVRSL